MTSPAPATGSRPGLSDAAPVRALRRFVEAGAVLGVASFSVLICAQVFYRYALNSSLVWSEELVQFILLWTVMFGSAIAADRGAHIALDPLGEMLGPRGRRLQAIVVETSIIVFCGVLAWYGGMLCWRTRFMQSSAADIPMWTVYSAMPVGAALIAVFCLVRLFADDERHADPMDERS